jgi:coproporphyrinogen III oxidase-like Fe-S oxidoreductase
MIDRFLAEYLRYANWAAMRLTPLPEGFSLPPADRERRYLLYVHVPFCPSLCPFCSFHRVALRDDKARRYFVALRSQIRQYAEAGFRLSGVYVGGGTPTVVPDELERTLELINELFGRQAFSVETNPSDLTPPVIAMLRRAGVARLSVGVQSFDDGLLRAMGRYEKYGSAAAIREHLAAVADAFPTLNVDMIFNLPGQTRTMLERDLDILAGELRVQQVSFYPLMVTGSTRLAMRERMGGYGANRERDYYRLIQQRLALGYRASSAWCFSRGESAIDEYIVTDDEYIGAGSGAFGYYKGLLYANTFSLNRYAQLAGTGDSAVTMAREMSELEQMRYDFLTRLFGLSLDKASIERKYDGRFEQRLWPEIAFFRAIGALRDAGPRLELTERGMYFWVVMMREFFTGVNRFREQMRLNIRHELEVPPTDSATPAPAHERARRYGVQH